MSVLISKKSYLSLLNRTTLIAVLLFLPSFCMAAWQSWPAVGGAQLTWGPWVIYDSELRTPSGRYQHELNDIALVIKYRRDIAKADLLEATDEQWTHLGISLDKRRQWLMVLAEIWPDIKKGDRLIFVISNEKGAFYQDNQKLGGIEDKEMSLAFIQIWLSPKTAYPNIRSQLIGNV